MESGFQPEEGGSKSIQHGVKQLDFAEGEAHGRFCLGPGQYLVIGHSVSTSGFSRRA